MCLQTSSVRPYQKWNWNGNDIVHDSAIPASRPLKAKGKVIDKYQVDIRQFLTIENNSVISSALITLIEGLSDNDKLKFYKSDKGNFDFRVRKCQEFLSCITYINSKSKYDQWQFPEETWELKAGDCEDIAFLLASLLAASRISDYCIRVALGTVVNHGSKKTKQQWEHAWVMYQNEGGVWEIIEPLLFVRLEEDAKPVYATEGTSALPTEDLDIEYLPYYVFNRSHLWRVRTCDPVIKKDFQDYIQTEREYFHKFNPGFAARVHNSIFDEALEGMSWFDRQRVKATSLYIDVNTIAYDPRDHFDFAYIESSWQRIEERLKKRTLEDFALAIHAIGDFYAHSYYGYFMLKEDADTIPLYNPKKPLPADLLTYDFSKLGGLPGCEAKGKGGCKPEQIWIGKLISGQWWRWYASIPDSLQDNPDFPARRCLPDHDAVAVDGQKFDADKHKLFNEKDYNRQFAARKKAAVEHIKQVYAKWNRKRKSAKKR
jgi:hypothetical protein